MTRVSYQVNDLEGDRVSVETSYDDNPDAIAFLHAHSSYLDREGAVGIIEALSALVEDADARAGVEEAKAARFKAGETVYGARTGIRYTVATDQTEDGYIGVVSLPSGGLHQGVRAACYSRTPSS